MYFSRLITSIGSSLKIKAKMAFFTVSKQGPKLLRIWILLVQRRTMLCTRRNSYTMVFMICFARCSWIYYDLLRFTAIKNLGNFLIETVEGGSVGSL